MPPRCRCCSGIRDRVDRLRRWDRWRSVMWNWVTADEAVRFDTDRQSTRNSTSCPSATREWRSRRHPRHWFDLVAVSSNAAAVYSPEAYFHSARATCCPQHVARTSNMLTATCCLGVNAAMSAVKSRAQRRSYAANCHSYCGPVYTR